MDIGRAADDVLTNILNPQIVASCDLGDEFIPVAQQANEDVLRRDVWAAGLSGFVAREVNNAFRPFRISFKHSLYLCAFARCIPLMAERQNRQEPEYAKQTHYRCQRINLL